MKKRLCAIGILILLLVALTSCGKAQSINYETDLPSGNLKIYYFVNGAGMPYYDDVLAGFKNAYSLLEVTAEAFTDPKTFSERLRSDRESDSMPDVLFFSCYAGTNWYDLIENGDLMELTPLLEADATYEDTLLLDGIAEACQYKHGQYIFPFTISLPFFLSSVERVHTYCPELESAVTAEERVKAVSDFLSTEREETPYSLAMSPGDFDLFNWGDALGLPLADFENRSVSEDADLTWLQRVYDLPCMINAASGVAWSDPRFSSVSITDAFSKTMLPDNCVFLYFPTFLTSENLRLAGAVYKTLGETMTLVPFPRPENTDSYGATIVSGGGITASSDNPTGGYFFLRYMMEHGQKLGYGLTVCRDVLSELNEVGEPWSDQLAEMLSNLSGVRMYTPGGPQWDALSAMNEFGYEPGGENFGHAWGQATSMIEQELFETNT